MDSNWAVMSIGHNVGFLIGEGYDKVLWLRTGYWVVTGLPRIFPCLMSYYLPLLISCQLIGFVKGTDKLPVGPGCGQQGAPSRGGQEEVVPALLQGQLHLEPPVLQARAGVRGSAGGCGPPRHPAVHGKVCGQRLLIPPGLRVLPERPRCRGGASGPGGVYAEGGRSPRLV